MSLEMKFYRAYWSKPNLQQAIFYSQQSTIASKNTQQFAIVPIVRVSLESGFAIDFNDGL